MTNFPGTKQPTSAEFPAWVETNRFLLRELTTEDATERYLKWLSESEARKWITAAGSSQALSDLRTYIFGRIGRHDVLFLGIFEKQKGIHIGNIKYEPVDSVAGYAVMGILIGDPAYRGKGVAAEALLASAKWLGLYRQISQILLGVDSENTAAIRAYEKIGFCLAESPHIQKTSERIKTMTWKIIN